MTGKHKWMGEWLEVLMFDLTVSLTWKVVGIRELPEGILQQTKFL